MKDVNQSRLKTNFSDATLIKATSGWNPNRRSQSFEEDWREKTAEKNDPEAQLEKEIEILQSQIDILKQIGEAYSGDVYLIQKLKERLDKKNQEFFNQHLQIFNSQQGYAGISHYKAAIEVSKLVDLSKQVKEQKLIQLKMDKASERLEKLKPIGAPENTSSTTSEKPASEPASEKKPEAEAKPAIDAAEEIKRFDTQLAGLQLIIDKNGKLQLIKKMEYILDKETEDDLDLILKQKFLKHFANASDEEMAKGAKILVDDIGLKGR